MNTSGKTIKELSVHFSVRGHKVGLWLQNWLSLGINGLKLVSGCGHKPKIAETDKVVLDRIENLLEEESRQLNHVLATIEKEFAIVMCKKTFKRLLRKKYRWKRCRKICPKKPNDELKKEKIEQLQGVKELWIKALVNIYISDSPSIPYYWSKRRANWHSN